MEKIILFSAKATGFLALVGMGVAMLGTVSVFVVAGVAGRRGHALAFKQQKTLIIQQGTGIL